RRARSPKIRVNRSAMAMVSAIATIIVLISLLVMRIGWDERAHQRCKEDAYLAWSPYEASDQWARVLAGSQVRKTSPMSDAAAELVHEAVIAILASTWTSQRRPVREC